MNLESLLVSRDSEVVRLLQATLEKLSIGVEVSAAARTGNEVLTSSKYDAVIIDCDDLQGGTEVLRHLRQTASNKSSVSFAILNGKTTTQQAFEMGANFVLQKPLTTSTTLRCFNTALEFMERERRRYFRCPVEFRLYSTSARRRPSARRPRTSARVAWPFTWKARSQGSRLQRSSSLCPVQDL